MQPGNSADQPLPDKVPVDTGASGLPNELARYAPQMRFAPIGIEGQRRLAAGRATLVGCGALGCSLANLLVRAGLGFLRIVDRDYLELENLQRQTLFDEEDVAADLPKAEAAARKLRKINSKVQIEAMVADFAPHNAESLCRDVQLVLDGTDNLETRFLLNDVAVKHDLPWVHAACLGAEGRVLALLPSKTACFRCLWEPLPPASLPTCETLGIVAPIVSIVAGFQAAAALQILTGQEVPLAGRLLAVDAWTMRVRTIRVPVAADCPCCRQRQFEFLTRGGAQTVTLCSRQAIQVSPAGQANIDLMAMARRLSSELRPVVNEFLLRFCPEPYEITLFRDGRAIIRGTDDPAVARSLYARYIGL
jgi:molybdopterin/thiamine biosynthesis adenylyltransferase